MKAVKSNEITSWSVKTDDYSGDKISVKRT
jgi:hypothetical protein